MIKILKKYKYPVIILIIICLILFGVFSYLNKKNDEQIEARALKALEKEESSEIYEAYKKLIPHFIIYEAYVNGKPLEFIRLGMDSAFRIDGSSQYYVPYYALEKSEAVIGYGIWWDITFEDLFSRMYERPSYAFDCAIEESPDKNTHPLCHFEPECIGTDKCILPWLTSTGKIHNFSSKLKQLNLEKKPIYIRFDTGAEGVPHIFDDILANSDYITGLNFVIHCDDKEKTILIEKLLSQIEKNFILIARHTHYKHGALFEVPNTKGYYGQGISLTYINRNLVDSYHIKLNQDTFDFKYDGSLCYVIHTDIPLYKYIPYVIKTSINDVIYEIKQK